MDELQATTVDALATLLEDRLGGLMLVRIGLVELVERFKKEEHALATSLKTILQLRDEERNAFRAQLDAAHAYTRQLEAQLLEEQRLRSQNWESQAAVSPTPPVASVMQTERAPAGPQAASLAPQQHAPPACAGSPTNVTHAGPVPPLRPDFEAVASRVGGGYFHQPAIEAVPPEAPPLSLQPPPVDAGPKPFSDADRGGVDPSTSYDDAAVGKMKPLEGSAPSDGVGGYLARVEQLQQRLAKERNTAVTPAGAHRQSERMLHQPSRPPLPEASIDPFDVYERGGLRTGAPRRLLHQVRDAHFDATRSQTPPNPAVVTGSGETFVFRHLSSGGAEG